MDWKALLQKEMAETYNATEGLINRLSDDDLGWKPAEGENWMMVSQLLHHIGMGLGGGFKGFVTGDWGFPEGVDPANIPMKDMFPPAERLPKVASIAEAKTMLEADKALAEDVLEKCSEEDLSNKIIKAPWDPSEAVLGHRLLQSIDHLKSHKSQLYYYIKLKGEKVGTAQLWGMG